MFRAFTDYLAKRRKKKRIQEALNLRERKLTLKVLELEMKLLKEDLRSMDKRSRLNKLIVERNHQTDYVV
jgi:hypothetical protein